MHLPTKLFRSHPSSAIPLRYSITWSRVMYSIWGLRKKRQKVRSSRSYPLTVCFFTLNCLQFLNFSIASLNSIKAQNPPRQIGGLVPFPCSCEHGRCRHVAGQTVVCHYHYSTSRRLPQAPWLTGLDPFGRQKFLLSFLYNRILIEGCQERSFSDFRKTLEKFYLSERHL